MTLNEVALLVFNVVIATWRTTQNQQLKLERPSQILVNAFDLVFGSLVELFLSDSHLFSNSEVSATPPQRSGININTSRNFPNVFGKCRLKNRFSFKIYTFSSDVIATVSIRSFSITEIQHRRIMWCPNPGFFESQDPLTPSHYFPQTIIDRLSCCS